MLDSLNYAPFGQESTVDYLPITVQLKDRLCLIVGGGEVAARKLKHLLKAESHVVVVSPSFSQEIEEVAKSSSVELVEREFDGDLFENVYLVIAATDDHQVNRRVSELAQEANIWVNVVDDLELSTFIMPAVIDRSPLLIAVSSSGVSPVLARKIREKIEWLLPSNLGSLLNKLKQLRPLVKKKFSDLTDKKRFSEWYVERAIDEKLEPSQSAEAILDHFATQYERKGTVHLVGAGPGDPELLTVKALKIIQKADIVLYDALVSDQILAQVRKDATLVHVGKRANKHFVTQERTNQLLVEYAQQGLDVVRLKGGDPFIFGRGGEELQFLVKHNIDYQVVPGITAAAGCASYSGIPLTHRDFSQSVHFVTAHEKNEATQVNWPMLAKSNQTLVFYMGLMNSQKIADRLMANGKRYDTPVAIIEKGTTKEQRVITGQLHELGAIVEQYQMETPSLIVVGEVVSLAHELSWFNREQVFEAEPYFKQLVNQ